LDYNSNNIIGNNISCNGVEHIQYNIVMNSSVSIINIVVNTVVNRCYSNVSNECYSSLLNNNIVVNIIENWICQGVEWYYNNSNKCQSNSCMELIIGNDLIVIKVIDNDVLVINMIV